MPTTLVEMHVPAALELTVLRRVLTAVRASLGVSAAAVARSADITPAYLSMIADGRRRPSPEVAERIAAALGLRAEGLFPDLEEQP